MLGEGTVTVVELSDADRRKIETLERVVLETLAKYGERLTAVEPGESVMVLVGSARTGDLASWQAAGFDYMAVESVPQAIERLEIQLAETPDRPDLKEQLRRVEQTLNNMRKQLDNTRDIEKMRDNLEEMKGDLEAYKAQLRAETERIENLSQSTSRRITITPKIHRISTRQ